MTPKTIALILIIGSFLLGIVGGMFVQRTFFDRHRPWDSSRRERMKEHMLNYLTEELKLNDAQQRQIETILEQRRIRFDKIRQSIDSLVKAEIDTVREQIRSVLADEQKQRYDEIIKKFDQQSRDRRRE